MSKEASVTDVPVIREFDSVVPRIVWGPGCAEGLEEQMSRIGSSRALLLCGRSVHASPWFKSIRERLGPKCAGVFGEVEAHTPIEMLRRLTTMARAHAADCIVMVGGGSVVDAGKLLALMLAEGEELDAYRVRWTPDRRLSIPVLTRPKLPVIAIPTTLSAAEVVGAATYVDGEQRFVIVDRGILPRVVMYDPRVAATTPRDLFLGTGMNAIAHCVEAIYSVRAQPFSEALAVGALRGLVEGLMGAAARPGDLQALERAQVGAALSGISYTNTWLGIAHSLVQALGARYRTAQGLLHAVMLPHAMRFNLPATGQWQELMSRAILDGMKANGQHDRLDDAGALIEALRDSIGLPKRLRDLGIPNTALDAVAEDTFVIWHTYFNPRRVENPAELREVLAAAW
jgi:alcohol dehydrogenase class IV